MRLDHLLSKEQVEMETSTLILRSIVRETVAEANEGAHVEAVTDSKSMKHAKAAHAGQTPERVG